MGCQISRGFQARYLAKVSSLHEVSANDPICLMVAAHFACFDFGLDQLPALFISFHIPRRSPAIVRLASIFHLVPGLVRPPPPRGHAPIASRIYLFFPPTPGTAVTCFIHSAICRSSTSSNDFSSTPRVDLPIASGVTGGTGSSAAPFTNMSLTWPAKPPQLKHQPSPTP